MRRFQALWWVGAGLLVSGSVIIGRREDGEAAASAGDVDGPDGKAKQANTGSNDSTTTARSHTTTTTANRQSPRLKSG